MTWDRSVVFGDFRLARAEQRLYRAGEEVRIDPKAWELLCYLVDHSGQLLTKATLFDELWKDVVVSDAALSQTILRLRSALGDSARQPRYIETLHRRGIRFIADIQSCSVGPSRPAGGEVRGVTDLAELSSPVSDAIFVGRERELERLAGALVCAERGQRQLVMVSGELGIGKTAILDRFVESLPTDWAVARGQCIEPHDSPEAYLPVFSAVEQLAQSDRRDAVIAVLRRCAPTWLAQMPWLVDTDEARALREQVSAGSRARMLREMVAALSALAGERGLLLVLEDLHWSDPATLDLLALLAHRGESARLIVAGNFRPAYALAHGHPIVELVRTLESKELCVAVRLEPLPLAGVREFVARRFPQGPLPDGFAEELLERTDGNPLFLKTIADHMVETGAMRRSDRGWELAGGIDFADAAIIPAGLRQMIEAVLRRIDAADLPLLDAASVAGTTFASAAVASGLDPGEASLELVESCCQRLINKWHVLQPASEQRWPDGTRTARYRFRHGLYRTVLYERLAPSVRRRLHQSIGERLEAAHGGGRSAVAAELASHFERSGDDARAVRYLIEAAFAARARFAEREAENDLSAALRHLEALPASEERDLQEILIRTARSLARLVTQGSALDGEEEQSVERAVTLLLARPGRPELFPLLRGCWQVQVFRCHPREMAILAQRLTDLAAASGKSDRLAEAALAQGMVELLTAELAAADATLGRGWQHFEAHSEQRAAQARPLTARWREIGVQLAIAHSWSQLFQGLVPATRQSHERALAVAATGAIHPFVLGGTRLAIAAMEAQIGDLAAALRHNESGRELAEEHQLLALRDALQLQRCYIRAAAGEPGAPEIDLTAQLALAASLHPSMFHPVSRLYVVRSCLLAGAVQPGLERLAALQADCAARGVRWFDAEMARLHQRLLAHGDG